MGGLLKAGIRHFIELTQIVEESRKCGHRMILKQRIKDSYVIRRAGVAEADEVEDDDADEEDSDSELIYVCTGIPILICNFRLVKYYLVYTTFT